jgi:mutator protein MutT
MCKAYAAGEQEIIPVPKKRDYQKIEAVLAIIKKDNRYLIQKRPSHGLLADLWEFPGGKRQTGETLIEALQREMEEELGVSLKEPRFLTKVTHAYTRFQVTLHAFSCQTEKKIRIEQGKHKWITLKGLRHFPLPSGSVKIIKFLETNPNLL